MNFQTTPLICIFLLSLPVSIMTLQMNLVFFVNITRVLFLKMFSVSAQINRGYNYRQWFKSTLVLVPLFGVHYVFLLIFEYFVTKDTPIEAVWLLVDLLFTSFQVSLDDDEEDDEAQMCFPSEDDVV